MNKNFLRLCAVTLAVACLRVSATASNDIELSNSLAPARNDPGKDYIVNVLRLCKKCKEGQLTEKDCFTNFKKETHSFWDNMVSPQATTLTKLALPMSAVIYDYPLTEPIKPLMQYIYNIIAAGLWNNNQPAAQNNALQQDPCRSREAEKNPNNNSNGYNGATA